MGQSRSPPRMFSLSSTFLLASLLVSSNVNAWNFGRAYPSMDDDVQWMYGRATESTAQVNGCGFFYSSPGYYLNVSDSSNVQINQGSISNAVTSTAYSKIGVDPSSLRVNTMDTKFTTFNGTSSADMPGAYGFVSARQGLTHTSSLDLTGTNFIFDRDTTMADYNQVVDGNQTSPHKLEMSSDNKRITLTVTAVTDKSGDYSDFWIDHVQLTCVPPQNAPPGYKINFSNLSAKTVDKSHSIGTSYSDSESGCRAQCNAKNNCAFVNTFKTSSSNRWNCAFFSRCTTSKSATGSGVSNSSGYCKT